MSNIYSPKELSKIYNRVKILYNPSGYSFKDRLVEHTLAENESKLMVNVDYGSEQTLLSLIRTHKKRIAQKSFEVSHKLGICSGSLMEEYDDMCSENARIVYPSHTVSTCTYDDNLSIAIVELCKILGISTDDLKSLELLEPIVTICYMLTTAYSVASDLKFAITEMPNMFTYEQLHSMQYLKDALDAKSTNDIYTSYEYNLFENVTCPSVKEANHSVIVGDWVTPTGNGVQDVIDTSTSDYKYLLTLIYLETIAFGLELTYLINTRTDNVTNRRLNELLLGSMKGVSNSIVDLIYKSSKGLFEPAIPLSDDCTTRFNEIVQYVWAVVDVVKDVVDLAIRDIAYCPIPALFSTIVSFAKNYSCRTIRVKQCAILYNYCKTNKLLKDISTDVMELAESIDHSYAKAIADEAEAYEGESKSKSMLDLSTHKSSMPKGTPGGGHDSASLSQALDGLIDNFRTDMYKFTVKDVYSDKEEEKRKYDTIASSIKLVNTQLTRQIREIKTYNTGGKYAGLSSGKLDRKALHRYKTDKNIFYQNTYKQKECDLAIGIVLDASGSMAGTGIEQGRITMIVLHETLKALGINHSIIDHTCYAGKYNSDLRRYQCFREDKGYRLCKNYALASIRAQSGNCDSGALWFMEKALQRTRNKDKICLIFSDGAPTECTGTDLVEQVKHMERNGIKVIGIGINFPSISRYYSEYANGKNLKEMLDITAGILKEYVLTKKD